MLSDKRLENLLRDAHAVDVFERGEEVASSRPGVIAPRRTRRWAYYAAAAIALFAVVQLTLDSILVPRQSAKKPPGTTAQVTPPSNPPSTSSLLLAVYQNAAGNLSCVNWSPDALKGREMSSFTAEELTRMGLALSCDPQAVRILVVGLEGPAAALPSSDDRAKVVAQCLSATPPCAPGTFNPKTCASAGCLDTEVKVRIESLALK